MLILWCYANGWGPWATFSENPVWLVGFALVLPLYHEFHFYCIHRLIHYSDTLQTRPFGTSQIQSTPRHGRRCRCTRSKHLLYWSDSLIHLLLPSHPLLALYNLQITGTGAVVGHVGFDKMVLSDKAAIDTHAYAHYLHHKYFEVNYGDGLLPIDKWTGTWHDGSTEGDALMKARLAKKRAKINIKQAA